LQFLFKTKDLISVQEDENYFFNCHSLFCSDAWLVIIPMFMSGTWYMTHVSLAAISTALTELQSKEPRKRRPIGFIVPNEKKE
jgi:hypothetical protein